MVAVLVAVVEAKTVSSFKEFLKLPGENRLLSPLIVNGLALMVNGLAINGKFAINGRSFVIAVKNNI